MQCPAGRHCSFGVQRGGIIRLLFGVAALPFFATVVILLLRIVLLRRWLLMSLTYLYWLSAIAIEHIMSFTV